LSRLLGADRQVLALGGGTPTAPGAADLIERERNSGRAWVGYLHSIPAVLRCRLAASSNAHRPSLTGAAVLDEIDEVYARRDGLYRALSNAVIETADRPLEAVVGQLAELFLGT
jgi:shikimate kinase